MNNQILMSATLSMLIPLAAFADEVTCESRDGQRNECPMDTRGAVRVVEQLSHAPCTEGVSWGLFKHSVWVSDGCRAVFASGGGHSANSGGLPNQVTCESVGKQRVDCPMNTRGVVRVVKQLSHSPCTEGVSWGLFKHSVWVSDGCRAVFALDDAGSSQSNGGNSHVSLNDLVGAKASNADSALRSRGFKDTGGYKQGNKSFVTWYNSGTRQCVQAVTQDGRIQSFENIYEGNCL